MDANDGEEYGYDTAEALTYLNKIAHCDLPINWEEEELQRSKVNSPFGESTLLRPFPSEREAY